ncbi:MAG: hypothetical protein A2Z24_01410 [Candidatus Woykebacteria bacterium RBG_16_44_10]|uniref:Glycosyltransferase RgtA/B/C/D-like domain-containing protein n=1 Tax=Candidatus Woykebacteria bacterium RBG_16_44_10 TaxID=1802597 RepID=A0A1G1WES6_9BACT|nr:MAG: hypothetical protein A2Z24_01410 [Candidatus Woykebacteria bacterium RBG_16_44_10]
MFKGLIKTTTRSHLLLFTLIFFFSALFFLKSRILGDPFSYYAWVRSAFFDHNFNFYNEYTTFNIDKNWTAIAWPKELAYTKIGLLNNPFSIGPAIFWTPFVILAFILTSLINILFTILRLPILPNGGYSFYYHFLVSFGNYFLGAIGIFLIYLILTRYFSKSISLLSTFGIAFGSSVFNYLYNEPTSSHVTSIFIISLFYFLFLNLKKNRLRHWLLLGVIGGLIFLVRWQQIIFILPAGWQLARDCQLKNILAFSLGFIPICSLQFLAWYAISGSFFYIPQGSEFVSLTGFLQGTPPNFIKILFSANHGLFYWTPVVMFALLGLIILSLQKVTLARWGLLILILSLIINSNLSDIHGGFSFSARRFTEDSLFLAIGLAGFLEWFKTNLFRMSFILVFSIWNVLLVLQYAAYKIPGWGYLVFPDWVKNQFTAWTHLPYFIGHSALGSNMYYFLKGKGVSFLIFDFIIVLSYLLGLVLFYKLGRNLTKLGNPG